MGIAERVYEVVKSLPERAAAEVLEFAEGRRASLAETEARKGGGAALSVVSGKPGSLKDGEVPS
jgi:hypothetical protein